MKGTAKAIMRSSAVCLLGQKKQIVLKFMKKLKY